MNAGYGVDDDMAAALFSYEFLDGGVDYDAVERIHRGCIDEWVEALDRSGLFGPAAVDELSRMWRRQPRTLLDTLLSAADQMTVRRCSITWSALDRLSPLDNLGQII